MKLSEKMFLSAAILVVVGVVIFTVALVLVNFDFAKLSTQKLETNIYEINEDFESIYVNVDTASVTLSLSNDGVCRVECVEDKNLKHSVNTQNGALMISTTDSRKWYNYIGINFRSPSVTLYLPKDTYKSLAATTTTGNIEISDSLTFETVSVKGTTSDIACCASVSGDVEIETTTGRITLSASEVDSVRLVATTGNINVTDVTCNTIEIKSSTGKIDLKNVISKGSMSAENTTGGVSFEVCDAANITVKTSTGNVNGTLLSEKVYITGTSTGRVRVPKSVSGGRCEIKTSTGNIEIDQANR